MDESDRWQLRKDCGDIVDGFLEYLWEQKNEQFLYELKVWIDEAKERKFSLDIEKIQVILAIMQSKNSGEIQEIRSYLENSDYGWQGDEYKFYSRCSWKCRGNLYIDNTVEMTEQAFSDIDKIFLNKEYGAITTYLFGYCIASLFSSRLKDCNLGVPYFLQIACKQNSGVYRLVHEIVNICDVNTALSENCTEHAYNECEHDHLTIYPSETGDKLLETLVYYKDIPIIVDGYKNEKLYEILIREVANIPRKIKRLDIKARFNILPVFLAPEIQTQFRNFFSIDLTELDVTNEYLELILRNKQFLGSWALDIVEKAKEYFDVGNSTSYSQQPEIAKIIESHRRPHIPKKRVPLFYDFDRYISGLRIKYNYYTKLTSKDIDNIGYLSYFFQYYMKVFQRSIRLTQETSFTYRGINDKYNPSKLIKQIVEQATDSLFQLHSVCSPTVSGTIDIDIEVTNRKNIQNIERKGIAYAKNIVKYYQSYKVNIRIAHIIYKEERYVFSVKLLPGTDSKLLSRYAEEVRRLLEIKYFMVDITSAEIKLVVSEKVLEENSLLKILESDQFRESKMEIPYAVGYDILGEMVIADIAEFPHLLVGGTSGSGKSSALHSLLMSIVCKQPANRIKLLLFDFGSSDLKIFDGVPHMLQPTIRVGEIEKARHSLLWLQIEMENRLKKKDALDKSKFDIEFSKWPSIVCVIDEFPALIRQLTADKYNRKSYMVIDDILARARKVKIHLVISAQNASKGNIDIGNTNLGASIVFRCTNRYDSEAIIGCSDAVHLFGKGTLLFTCCQFEGLKRIQGAFMSPDEIIKRLDTMNYICDNDGKTYDEVTFESLPSLKPNVSDVEVERSIVEDSLNELLCKIIKLALKEGKLSNNMIKNTFKMGYSRANKYLSILEEAEIISKQREGARLEREVNSDKANTFLKEHSFTGNTIEENMIKTVKKSDAQDETEPIQEHNVEPPIKKTRSAKLPDDAKDMLQEIAKKMEDPFGKSKNIRTNRRRPAH